MTTEELRAKLDAGVFKFQHTKVNGEWRTVSGTRDLTKIPADQHPKNISEGDQFPGKAIAYFDFNVRAWRSLNVNCEIKEYKDEDNLIIPNKITNI